MIDMAIPGLVLMYYCQTLNDLPHYTPPCTRVISGSASLGALSPYRLGMGGYTREERISLYSSTEAIYENDNHGLHPCKSASKL